MLHLQGAISASQTSVLNAAGILAQVDPASIADAANSVGIRSSTTPEGLVWSAIALALTGGVGWFVNRRLKSSDAVNDASNDFRVDSLKDAREQITSLSEEVTRLRQTNQDLFTQVQSSSMALLQSELLAKRMEGEAATAKTAAQTAQASLDNIRTMFEELKSINRAQTVYIVKLQQAMMANNIPFEPFEPFDPKALPTS